MSPERRALFDKEADRERKAAELEAEQRREAAAEHRWELERQGITAHSLADVFALQARGEKRADNIEAERVRRGDEQMGRPEPRLNRWELKAEQAEREKAKETTPATVSDMDKLVQKVQQLASKVGILGRRRSADQGYHQPRNYVRNSGGYVIRGPY